MNVASLELCKELKELSGWGGTTFFWKPSTEWGHTGGSYGRDASGEYELSTGVVEDFDGNIKPMLSAYDLGYLLRKLPNNSEVLKISDSYIAIIAISIPTELQYSHWSDTPEDAACKLTIELFKQGILKRGES